MAKSDPALAALPEPTLVETLDFEAILARRKAKFREIATARGLDIAEYIDLESAPETVLLEEAANAEELLRNRINQTYRGRLTYFAQGSDLDHCADDFGLERLPIEQDEALRNRIRISNRGSSAAGPDDWWRRHVLDVDASVEDVAITRARFPYPAPGEQRGQITLSVLVRGGDGTPSVELLDRIRAHVTSAAVRVNTTAPIVRAATQTGVAITATVWLLPDAPVGLFATLESALRDKWAADRGLGWDVTQSWVMAALHVPGVQRVETAFQTVSIPDDQAPRLDAVALTPGGIAR